MSDERSQTIGDPSPQEPPREIGPLLVHSLEQRWSKYLKELRLCKRAFSEESVHDLRVATRRLISTLMIVEILLPDDRTRKVRRRLKRLFDALSPLRDTQVQLATIERKLEEHPELETLLTVLRVRERDLTNSIAGRIVAVQTVPISRTLRALKKTLRTFLAQPGMQMIGLNAVLGAAATRFLTAVASKERVRATQPRTIHRARIEFKKLRYTLEALAPIVSTIGREQLKTMDTYQTRMGNIQDAQVLNALVREFARRRSLPSRRKLSAYQRELIAEKRELISMYLQSADELYLFWR